MDLAVFTRPPKIDPAVWRPEVPLVVIERCLHGSVPGDDKRLDPAKLIVTWLALRWLMAAFPKRKGYPTRMIAERVGAHMTNITAWCRRLQALGLLEKIGEEPLPRNLSRGEPLPIYTIPLLELESASRDLCLEVIMRMGFGESESTRQPEEQLALDLTAPDRLSDQENGFSDRLSDQVSDRIHDQVFSSDRIHDQVSDRLSDQENGFSDRLSDQVSDRLSDHRKEGRKEGGRKEAHSLTRDDVDETPNDPDTAPPRSAPPPTPPDDLFRSHVGWQQPGALASHPLDLWQQACPDPRPVEDSHLTVLAQQHDTTTGGHGWYWVGHAILAASLNEDVRSVTKIRTVLNRWRTEDSYGSDVPLKEHGRGRHPTRNSGSDGPDRPGPGDRAPDRVEPPQRRSKRDPRPGSADYNYD